MSSQMQTSKASSLAITIEAPEKASEPEPISSITGFETIPRDLEGQSKYFRRIQSIAQRTGSSLRKRETRQLAACYWSLGALGE